jgi:hypothetical protein
MGQHVESRNSVRRPACERIAFHAPGEAVQRSAWRHLERRSIRQPPCLEGMGGLLVPIGRAVAREANQRRVSRPKIMDNPEPSPLKVGLVGYQAHIR